MKLTCILIRHGQTQGNREHRYIGGRTDEPLCAEGRQLLAGRQLPEAEKLFASPLRRCLETAALLYPDLEPVTIDELKECDFGVFENQNAEELAHDPRYQAWIDSGGYLSFPEGESRDSCRIRNLAGFRKALAICRQEQIRRAAFVVHGGTIMSIMSAWAVPAADYFDFQTKNGEGYVLDLDTDENTAGPAGLLPGSADRRPGLAVSSDPAGREADRGGRKNYQRLAAADESR